MSFAEALKTISDGILLCYRNRYAEGCADFYAEDGVLIDAQSHAISGRTAIFAHFRRLMREGVELTEFETLWHDSEGDMGCAIQRQSGANTVVMLALRREADGKWRITREMVTEDDSIS